MIVNIIKSDIWDLKNVFIGIPVNKHLICGRGIAFQWKQLFPEEYKIAYKNKTSLIEEPPKKKLLSETPLLISYKNIMLVNWHFLLPVKYQWYEKASLELISKSLKNLSEFFSGDGEEIYLPKMGCGFGELSWDSVLPLYERSSLKIVLIVPDPEQIKERYPRSVIPSIRKDRLFS
jgi:hypothetical protein